MNANVLHRWLKEHHTDGRHQLKALGASGGANVAAFIPLQLPAPTSSPEHTGPPIRLELRKGAMSMSVTWPVSAAADCANWVAALLK